MGGVPLAYGGGRPSLWGGRPHLWEKNFMGGAPPKNPLVWINPQLLGGGSGKRTNAVDQGGGAGNRTNASDHGGEESKSDISANVFCERPPRETERY